MAGSSTEITVNVDSTIKGLNEIEKGASKASGSINELSKSFGKLGKTSVDMSSAKALEVIKQRIEKLVPAYNKLLVLQDKVNPLLEVEDIDNLEPTKAKNYSRKESRQNKRVSSSINEIQGLWVNLDKSDRNKLFSWGQKNIYSPERNPEGNLKANPFKGVEIDPNLLLKAFIGKLDPDALYRGIYNKNSNSNKKLLSYDEYEEYEAKSKNKINEADFEILEESFADLSDAAKTAVNSFSELSKTGSSIREKTVVENPVKETKQEDKHTYDVNGALDALLKNNSNPEYDWVYDYVKEGPKETKQEEIISEIKEIHSALTNSSTPESSGGKETSRRINGQVFKPSDLDDPILGKAIKQALQGNNAYGRNVRVAEGNLQIARNEEPFKIAKLAMQVQNRSLGGGKGNDYVKNMGEALTSQLSKAFNNGFKNINFGKLLEDSYVQRAKSKKQDKVFDNFALGTNQLFATDTLYNKDEFKDILEKTEAFKEFAEKLREDLEVTESELPDDEIYDQLKSGKQSRQSIISGLTDKDKKSLGDYVGGLTSNKEGRKELLNSLKRNAKDRSTLLGGIVQEGGKGASSLMGIAGKVAAPIALVQGLTSATKAVLKFADGTIQAYEGIQKLQTQLSVVFATTTQASSTFNEIAEYAKKSPFGVEQTTQEAILLKQSGVYSSELMDTIKRIGDLSSGSAEKMKSISEVYARVMSSTTVTARDMRQLANAGVASYSALSKATGTDKSLIRAQLQSGKVTSQDFKAMVKELTDEGGMFYGATERGAKTIAARKQNLSDAKQLATSEIGRFFANLGGNTTQDSLYGKGITLLENIYGVVEEGFKEINNKNEAEAVENYVVKLKDLYQKRDKLEDKGKDTTKVDKEIAELETKIRSQQGASSAAGVSVYDKALEEVKESLAKYGKDLSWLDETVPNRTALKKLRESYVPDTGESQIAGLTGDDDVISLLQNGDFTSNLQLIMSHSIDKLFSEVTKAGQAGADMLDAAINEIDTALDDVENTQNRLQDLSAAQTRTSAARRDWNQNSPVAQMMLKDAQAQRDDYLKQRITYYEGKTLDKETGKFDFSKLGIEEFAEAAKMITTEARKLDLDLENGHVWDQAANKGQGAVTEEGVETFAILKENLEEVYATLINDGGEDLVGKSGMKDFESLISMLGQDVSKFDKDKLEALMKLLDKVNKKSEEVAEAKGEKGEKYKEIVQAAQTETVRDTSNAKYLNKRKQAVLWAQILSQTTGISAERVQGVGAAKAMTTYTTNFAQREMFSSLGKALMSNGSSLKDLSKILKDNHKGTDSYGHDLYDWQSATASAEQLAAKQSLETQGALIDAYQQQIDVLTDLEMSGIATRDQWDNVGALAAQLGTGFSLAAEEMADGSYRFTEATIQAAEDMKAALNAKKFVQELNYILRDAREQVNEETRNAQLLMSGLSGSINLGGGLNTEQTQKVVDAAITKMTNKTIAVDNNVFKSLGLTDAKGNLKVNLDEKQLQTLQSQLDTMGKVDGSNYRLENIETTKSVWKTVGLDAKDLMAALDKIGGKQPQLAAAEYKKGNIWYELYEKAVKENDKARKNNPTIAKIGGFTEWSKDNRQKLIEALEKELQSKPYEYTNVKVDATGKVTASKSVSTGETISTQNTRVIKTDSLGNETNIELKDLNLNLKDLQDAVKNGTATEEQRSIFISTMLSADQSLTKEIQELNESVKRNTAELNKANKAKETSQALDILKEYRQMSGYQGADIKAAYEERAYSDMPDYAPLRMSMNSWAKEQALQLMGYPTDANWKNVMGRVNEQYMPETLKKAIKNGDSLDAAQQVKLSDYQEYLGKYLYENIDELFLNTGSDEIIAKKKELKGNLKDLLGAGENGEMGYENIENFKAALEELEKSGVGSIDKLTEAWVRSTTATIEASMTMKEFGENMRQAFKDSSLNAILSTTQLIGENWYKINNDLMTQEEALDSIKRSLAGQAAELMNTISKEAVIAGLRLIGSGAMSQNWGMIAAGAGLIAVGGMAGIAGGLLKGYSEDSESNDMEQKLNRLESLRDNLANLLKQAKADAEYYEVNLRAKQAFATNEGISVTKTNDMILSPSGVFSTHPDDYIMAMKDPASLMGNGGSPVVNFTIVNSSGTNLNVERSKTTQDGNNIDIEVVVNGIVQKGMVNGEYDNAFTAMQARNEGVKTSA